VILVKVEKLRTVGNRNIEEENDMGKLVVAIIFTVLIVGSAMYLASSKVAPGVTAKGTSINTSLTTASVSASTGVVTATAP
jgi:hypothetical protein